MNGELPVYSIIPQLIEATREGRNVVLIAPPGSGKTTQVPQALLKERSLKGMIVVVQPRRIACRSVARRVAEELGVTLGEEVGYIVRYERKYSPRTRLLFATDGILMRLMEEDPDLRMASVVIFDEFHERRANVDLVLGLLKQTQTRRHSLRLIAMSATMQSERVSNYLSAVTLQAEGRTFPVEIRHDNHITDLEEAIDAIPRVVTQLHTSMKSGDILIFLPGKEEIRRAGQLLARLNNKSLTVFPLHGDLPQEEQDLVFEPTNNRKIILSTNVAETSLTIPGLAAVIDTGYERRAEFDTGLRISRLELVRISKASADQRAGRAGRERPGICIRLWKQALHKELVNETSVEMRQVDLASVVMTLKSIGIHDSSSFDFLDPPDAERLIVAEELLTQIGALDQDGHLTPIGWHMLRLPLPPRYARMVVEGEKNACLNEMATISAMMAGRSIFSKKRAAKTPDPRVTFTRDRSSDFFTFLNLYEASRRHVEDLDEWSMNNGVNVDALREATRLRHKIISTATERGSLYNRQAASGEMVRRCVLTGLIDMLAQRRQGRKFLVSNGMSCTSGESCVDQQELVVAAEIRSLSSKTASASEGRIDFLTQVDIDVLRSVGEHLLHTVRQPIGYDATTCELLVREEVHCNALMINSCEKRVRSAIAMQIIAEQRTRAEAFGWVAVNVSPGMNRRAHVEWMGKKIPVEATAVGPHWATVQEGKPTTVVLRERIIEALQPATVSPPAMKAIPEAREASTTSGLPIDLQQRLSRLSPKIGKLLGKT